MTLETDVDIREFALNKALELQALSYQGLEPGEYWDPSPILDSAKAFEKYVVGPTVASNWPF